MNAEERFRAMTNEELANCAAIVREAAKLSPKVWDQPHAVALGVEMWRRGLEWKNAEAPPLPPLQVRIVDYGPR